MDRRCNRRLQIRTGTSQRVRFGRFPSSKGGVRHRSEPLITLENAPSCSGRTLIICFLCLTLAGCFFVPGRFESSLEIHRDGTFSYRYSGVVAFLLPSEEKMGAPVWSPDDAECFDLEADTARSCTEAEIAVRQREFDEERARTLKGGEEMAELIGFNPVDPEANRALAKRLEGYPGWKKVEYLGNGRFHVEYAITGSLEREFAFPVVPGVQFAMPFVTVGRDRGGVIEMKAAGLASEHLRRMLEGQVQKSDADSEYWAEAFKGGSGPLTITTDAEVLSTNGATSAAGGETRIGWTIDGARSETPILRLRTPTN